MSAPLSLLPKIKGVKYRYCPGFPGYAVGTNGSVWSCRRKGCYGSSFLSRWHRVVGRAKKYGHRVITVSIDGVSRNKYAHQLVLTAFVGPCPAGMEGCHWDGNPANNRLLNLRWDTHANNVKDSFRHGTWTRGERHHSAKLTAVKVRAIRRKYEAGLGFTQLGREYGVSAGAVTLIVQRRNWKHVA